MKQCPSIVVIILDALRAKNVSCYGYPLRTTPCLDALAAKAVQFKRAYTTSTWTIPTHASMLTGLYLSQHRLENIERNRQLHERVIPLPGALSSAGYRTAAFSQNPLFSPTHHFDFFDEFYGPDDLGVSGEMSDPHGDGPAGLAHVIGRARRYLGKVSRPRVLFDRILEWINVHGTDVPFFLMTNLPSAHYPWAPPLDILLKQLQFDVRHLLRFEYATLDPWRHNAGLRHVTARHRDMWRRLYDAAIMHLDRELGRFLRRLGRWEGWQNLIVVITSDHGEMLGDYRDLVGHTLSLHDNIMHVPLVLRHPDYPPGLVVEGVVQNLDLYSSVLEWAGLAKNSIPAAQLQRPSWSRAVDASHDPYGYAFAEEDYTDSYDVLAGLIGTNPTMEPDRYPRQQVAVHSAWHKYIWYDDRPAEFYDLARDPFEEHNLLPELGVDPVLVEHQQALEEWLSALEVFPPREVESIDEMDEETLSRLRALGYVA